MLGLTLQTLIGSYSLSLYLSLYDCSLCCNRCLINHENGNPAVIQYFASGSGGVEEFASNLQDGEVMYGLG